MAQISAILSGAVSFGVLVGVMSGIFYLVLTGIRWAGRVRASLLKESQSSLGHCVACSRGFAAHSAVRCELCRLPACKGAPCSKPANDLTWICVLCQAKRDIKPKTEKQSKNDKTDGADQRVRQFIENVVQNIVGGSLDVVNLGRLSSRNECKNGSDEESPSSIHDELSQLIAQIIEEARKLPNLTCNEDSLPPNEKTSEEFEGKSYEDILATAILNKVIETYQESNYNSSETNEKLLEDREFSEPEPLSLTIEETIEEVTTYASSSSEDEEEEEVYKIQRVPFPEYGVDIVDGINRSDSEEENRFENMPTSNETWEDNWLFRKKRLKRSDALPPVPMLVPNPSQEYRALIGGVDADDISDLSECSESALEEALSEAPEDVSKSEEILDILNNTSENSKVDVTNSSLESDFVDGVSTASTKDDQSSGDTLISAESLTDEFSPPSSLTQQDREIVVDYDANSRIKTPVPRPRTLDFSKTSDEESESRPRCLIAEREKAKWNNPVSLENNPYSSENIAKRLEKKNMLELSRSASIDALEFAQEDEPTTVYPVYSRDYYIKASRSPTGEERPRQKSESPVSLISEPSREKIEAKVKIGNGVLPTYKLPKLDDIRTNLVNNYTASEQKEHKTKIDFEPKPIAKIIEELLHSTHLENPPLVNKQEEVFKEIALVRENSKKEIETTVLPSTVDKIRRRPVKPVHSLTARSISKDFRETLKQSNNSVKSNATVAIPDPESKAEEELHLFDIRGRKKYWEELVSKNK